MNTCYRAEAATGQGILSSALPEPVRYPHPALTKPVAVDQITKQDIFASSSLLRGRNILSSPVLYMYVAKTSRISGNGQTEV